MQKFFLNTIKEFEDCIERNEQIKSLINTAKQNKLDNLMWEFKNAPEDLQRIFRQEGGESFIIFQFESSLYDYESLYGSPVMYSVYHSHKLNIKVIILY